MGADWGGAGRFAAICLEAVHVGLAGACGVTDGGSGRSASVDDMQGAAGIADGGVTIEVGRADGDFAVAAGDVQDVGGPGQAGDAAAEGAEDGLALGDGDPEAGGAGGGVEVVQIVGFHAGAEHGPEQGFQGVGAVIDAAEEDGLAEQGGAGGGEAAEGGVGFGGELAGVVGVYDDPEGG